MGASAETGHLYQQGRNGRTVASLPHTENQILLRRNLAPGPETRRRQTRSGLVKAYLKAGILTKDSTPADTSAGIPVLDAHIARASGHGGDHGLNGVDEAGRLAGAGADFADDRPAFGPRVGVLTSR